MSIEVSYIPQDTMSTTLTIDDVWVDGCILEMVGSVKGELGLCPSEASHTLGYDPASFGTVATSTFAPMEELPDRVRYCISTLNENSVWYELSRNPPAHSCSDAASKRWRDGHVGIPLGHEMKSLVYKQPKGIGYVALHCRGSDRIDMPALKDYLGTKTSSVGPEELAEQFNAQFGTVNPVLLTRAAKAGVKVRQICDTKLMDSLYTVMTNAGDHQYGLEVSPLNLFEKLPASLEVAEITQNCTGDPDSQDAQDSPTFSWLTVDKV
jgi:prolyl-tRNA editing enzyme YbaK/EbsC (Cys-tRNA(Pro) deacylase)